MNIPILVVIIVYLAAMLAIGFWASTKCKSDEDFLMGGFGFGVLPMTGTYMATFFSALSLLGSVGLIYRAGIGGSWMPMAWALGSAFGPILAIRFRRVRVISPSEYFEKRYGDKGLQIFGASAGIISLLFNMVVQITAMGVIWNLATGRSVTEGLIIGTIIVIVYTAFGGFYAVVWTDVVQCATFLIVIGIAVVAIIAMVGTPSEIYAQAALINTAPEVGAETQEAGSLLTLLGTYGALSLFFTFLIQGPGTGTKPEYLQRMQAAKDIKTTLKTYKYAWIILIFVYIGLNIFGVGARVLIPTMPDGMTSDWIMPFFFVEYTNPIIAGLFFAGLLAAAMSTIDSSIIVISAFAADIVKVARKGKELDGKRMMTFSRCVTILAGIIVMFMAMNTNSFITDVAGYGFGILGLTFFIPLVFGLYWKRANRIGCWACIIGGSITFIIWTLLGNAGLLAGSTVLSAIPPLGMAIFIGCILMWVVSLMTKPMNEKYWKPYLTRPEIFYKNHPEDYFND